MSKNNPGGIMGTGNSDFSNKSNSTSAKQFGGVRDAVKSGFDSFKASQQDARASSDARFAAAASILREKVAGKQKRKTARVLGEEERLTLADKTAGEVKKTKVVGKQERKTVAKKAKLRDASSEAQVGHVQTLLADKNAGGRSNARFGPDGGFEFTTTKPAAKAAAKPRSAAKPATSAKPRPDGSHLPPRFRENYRSGSAAEKRALNQKHFYGKK
jgi:hypothetical protein